jgi:hypothetical protein
MANTNVNARASMTNGVSYGYKYTLTATDVTNGGILFNFNVPYALVAHIIWTDTSGTIKAQAGQLITYPAVGQVQIVKGSTTFVAGDIFHVIAQRAGS